VELTMYTGGHLERGTDYVENTVAMLVP